MLQDLRRFAMFDSSATRPYTISACACWERAVRLNYISLDPSGKVRTMLLNILGLRRGWASPELVGPSDVSIYIT